jgi:hypothetical protein
LSPGSVSGLEFRSSTVGTISLNGTYFTYGRSRVAASVS